MANFETELEKQQYKQFFQFQEYIEPKIQQQPPLLQKTRPQSAITGYRVKKPTEKYEQSPYKQVI